VRDRLGENNRTLPHAAFLVRQFPVKTRYFHYETYGFLAVALDSQDIHIALVGHNDRHPILRWRNVGLTRATPQCAANVRLLDRPKIAKSQMRIV
jgi:hypothetical protein